MNHFVVTAPLGRYLKERRQMTLEEQKSSKGQKPSEEQSGA